MCGGNSAVDAHKQDSEVGGVVSGKAGRSSETPDFLNALMATDAGMYGYVRCIVFALPILRVNLKK